MKPLCLFRPALRRATVRALAAACALSCAGVATADDIDIFTGNNSTSKPNVLIVIDSSSNWSSTLGPNPCNTGNTATTTKFGAEICALTTAIAGLGSNVRIGLMMFAETGTNGGYVRFGMRDMTTQNKNALTNMLKSFVQQGSGTDNSGSNQPYGKTMYEVFKYFGGFTSPAHATDDTAGSPTDAQHFGTTALSGGNTNNTGSFRRDYPNNNTPSNRAASGYNADNNNAYSANNSDTYVTPINDGCAKNFVIFISNGNPGTGGDSGSPATAAQLLTNVGGNTTQITNAAGSVIHASLFDEYTRFLYQTDVSSQSGQQRVTTYTLAVYQPQSNGLPSTSDQAMIDLMKSGATAGGGKPFIATSASDVANAINTVLNEVQAVNSVFVSASLPVSVNTQGTYLNQVYMGMFRPDASGSPRWLGNLKQYKIDQDSTGALFLADSVDVAAVNPATGFTSPGAKSFWSAASTFWTNSQSGTPLSASDLPDGEVVEKGGAAEQLRTTLATSQSGRKVYTCPSTGCAAGLLSAQLAFNTTNIAGASYQTQFGVLTASALSDLVNWIIGTDNVNGTPSGTGGWTSAELGPGWTTTVRPSIHGDVLHSRPVVLNYPSGVGPYIFYGANDGTLRGTKGGRLATDGNESWSFVAPEFFGKFNRLRTQVPELMLPGTSASIVPTPLPKDYFFDGSLGSYQSTDLATEYIYATARRGGRLMYAFDVSSPTAPKFMWKKTNTDLAELGQTWSEPIAFKVKAQTNPVIMFSAGYDNVAEDSSPAGVTTMGRGIYVLDAVTGALVRFFQAAANGGSISSSVPSDVSVLDIDGDTFADRAYVGDMGGNVWRMDIDNADPAQWKLFKLAALGPRKFFFRPDVIVSKNFALVLVGSGDREKPLDTTSADNFYMLKDTFTGKDATGMVAIVASDLVTAGTPVNAAKGWYLALAAGEKVINAPLSIAGTTFFSTNQPSAAAGSVGVCSVNLGVARAYAVNFLTGTAALDRNNDGTKNASDLAVVLTGGGLPPSPVGGVVELDNGKKVDFIIGSGAGGSPITPTIPPRSVPSVRKKVYWNTQNDS